MSARTWILAMTVTLAVVGLAFFVFWPRETKDGSQALAPRPRPPEETSLPDAIVWRVPPSQADPEVEREIKEAIRANESLASLAEEQRQQFGQDLSIEKLEVEGAWADLDAAFRDRTTGDLVGTEGLPLLARKANGYWEVVGPEDERFFQWLTAVPDSLISPEIKDFLHRWYGGKGEDK